MFFKFFFFEKEFSAQAHFHVHGVWNADAHDVPQDAVVSGYFNQALVHVQLPFLVSVGAVSAGSLASGNPKFFGGQRNRAFYFHSGALCNVLYLPANRVNVLNVLAHELDSCLTHFYTFLNLPKRSFQVSQRFFGKREKKRKKISALFF
jgi:hypothetical protein